jgi:uncharacterized protein YqgC (DUF456 family)
MQYFWIALLIIVNTFSLILVPFGLPGNWLIVITTTLFGWWQRESNVFSIYTLIIIAVLALAGEIIEFFAGTAGARKAGAGWLAAIVAIFGGLLGAIVGTLAVPLLGTIIGACLGAGLGVYIVERRSGKTSEASMRSGMGASVGRFIGTIAKLAIGVAIWLIVAVAAFWP